MITDKKMVLATRNKKKLVELQAILKDMNLEILSLDSINGVPEVEEDGQTFAANATKKARVVAEATGLITLGDDSGLEVEALGGQPGVYSARFAGEPGNDARNNAKLLDLMKDVPPDQRSARFRCVIAIAVPGGGIHLAEGACAGRIGYELKGSEGFGYDPLFIVEGYEQTFAQLPAEVKNRISHRARALVAARQTLLSLWEGNI